MGYIPNSTIAWGRDFGMFPMFVKICACFHAMMCFFLTLHIFKKFRLLEFTGFREEIFIYSNIKTLCIVFHCNHFKMNVVTVEIVEQTVHTVAKHTERLHVGDLRAHMEVQATQVDIGQ